MKISLIILLLISPTLSAETRLDIHGLSYHSVDTYDHEYNYTDVTIVHKDIKYNSVNKGAGITQDITDKLSISIGSYENSYWRPTVYALTNYNFYTFYYGNSESEIKLGGSLGLVTGYHNKTLLVMVPTVHFNILKIGVIPKLSRETTNSLFISLSVRIL